MTRSARSASRLAAIDIVDGVKASNLWGMLAWQDIRQRYRRSMLGPFWLTLSTAVMVIALGLVYSTIFRMSIDSYLPYLAAGLVVWTLISTIMSEGCQAFVAVEGLIRQIRLPFTVHACRVIYRNIIILAHNLIIVVVVLVVFRLWPKPMVFALLIPALLLTCVTGLWASLLLGLLCARFRDIPPIVTSLLQIAFFLTPILWHPELLPGRHRVIQWNPFYHYVELVRAPLLGNAPPPQSWVVAIALTLAGSLLTFVIFSRYRARIAFWV